MSTKFEKIEHGLWKYKKTGVIYARETFRKDRIPDLFETTGETTVLKARNKRKSLIAIHMTHYLGGSSAVDKRRGYSIGSIIEEFLSTETPTRREGTRLNHLTYLTELKTHWGAWDVSRITEVAWRQWLLEFKRQKKNRKSFWDYTVYMNMILRYAYKNRYAPHLLTLKNNDPIKTDSGRVFTEEEIKSLWEVMNEDTRDQFILSYECFMRLREVLYLEWNRIDFRHKTITLRKEDVKTGSRTGKGRTFRVSEAAFKRLSKRAEQPLKSEFVFPSPVDPSKPVEDNKTAWVAAKRAAKIKGRARWHDLRHTAITRALLENKTNPLLVSEYAGLSMRTIQKVYLHAKFEHTASVANVVKISTSSVKTV